MAHVEIREAVVDDVDALAGLFDAHFKEQEDMNKIARFLKVINQGEVIFYQQ